MKKFVAKRFADISAGSYFIQCDRFLIVLLDIVHHRLKGPGMDIRLGIFIKHSVGFALSQDYFPYIKELFGYLKWITSDVRKREHYITDIRSFFIYISES
jgi:hypothetical protein